MIRKNRDCPDRTRGICIYHPYIRVCQRFHIEGSVKVSIYVDGHRRRAKERTPRYHALSTSSRTGVPWQNTPGGGVRPSLNTLT